MMKLYRYFILLSFFLPMYFFSSAQKHVEIQGHRGARGLMPENTIPGFIKALETGISVLEMDVVITKDRQVILSHEPYISPTICLDRQGNTIDESNEREYNIYEMNYEQVKEFDCGSKVHPQFDNQQKFSAAKPLLKKVIDSVEQYAQENELAPVRYTIEIKSTLEGDGEFHPAPRQFATLVLDIIEEKKIDKRTIIQSFDVRALQEVKSLAPEIELSLLVGNEDSPRANIQELEFIPDIYSPHYSLVNKSLISYAKQLNMKVVPWTVNHKRLMKKMIKLGVNGLITDYPNLAMEVINENKQ